MLKYGIICEVDNAKGLARVHFDEIDIVSGWLSLPTQSTKGNKHFVPIAVTTQVAVLMHPDGEQGEIIKAIWSDQDTPPSWADENTQGIEFEDGTIIQYIVSTHKLNVQLCSGGSIETNGENEVIKAILSIINGAPIPEPGNGANSVFQTMLKTAVTGKDQGKWTKS